MWAKKRTIMQWYKHQLNGDLVPSLQQDICNLHMVYKVNKSRVLESTKTYLAHVIGYIWRVIWYLWQLSQSIKHAGRISAYSFGDYITVTS